MGVGSGLYMYDVVVKKVHVHYLISWWVLVPSKPHECRIQLHRKSDNRCECFNSLSTFDKCDVQEAENSLQELIWKKDEATLRRHANGR